MHSAASSILASALLLAALAPPGCRATPPAAEGPAPTAAAVPDGITAVHIPPFRVLGDESPEQVHRRAESIRRAADLLRSDLFTADPAPTLDIWLFRDAASTAEHTRRLFGHEPDPPEGFYSVVDHAVVADISQGDRTPVHFLTHAYVHANIPGCPVWFDEGLAALYEGGDGDVSSITELPTARELTGLDQAGFHGPNWRTHRTAAHLLCSYLRHEGRLRQTLEQLQANLASDPTGYETLHDVLGLADATDLQGAWEQWLRNRQEEG